MKNLKLHQLTAILLFILFFLLSNINQLKASHATGAEFTYFAVNQNVYEITYTFYRDCHGILPDTAMEIFITNECGYPDQSVFLSQEGTELDVVTTCPIVLTECHNGAYVGIQKWIYSGRITLAGTCIWKIGRGEPARKASISTITGNGIDNLYVYCIINNTSGIANSSPSFYNDPVFNYSINQRLSIDNSVYENDGDSIVYEMIVPRTGPTIADTVTFLPGYSFSQPFISSIPVSIDSESGLIEGIPQQTDVSIYAVLISEFRNSILIGQIVRDMNFHIESSVNLNPDISGINGSGSYEVDIYADQYNCFEIGSYDFNSTNKTYMELRSSNSDISVDHTGGLQDTLQICWTPSINDIIDNPHCFTVSVRDDNCPYQGYQVRNYCINVQMPTLVNELNSDNISIYPNPFNSEITIKLEQSGTSELKIFDMQGRKIVSKIIDSPESVHDFNNLDNGVYLVSVTDSETNKVYKQRLLKVN